MILGHNNPPKTEFEEISQRINDLYEEAKHWLDGESVTNQDQANDIQKLISLIKSAIKEADFLRVKEVKPLDDAKQEIQNKYNQLIGENKTVTGIAILAVNAAKKALLPYQIEIDRKQREEAEKARQIANEAKEKAEEAITAVNQYNLEETARAEHLIAQSKQAQLDAKIASQKKVNGLSSYYVAKMVNMKSAIEWAWNFKKDDVLEFIQSLADKEVRKGAREISGFEITEEKRIR